MSLTPKEMAQAAGTDAKSMRKFLRQEVPDAAPGKGGRWAIDARSKKSLLAKFKAWDDARHATDDDEVEASPAE